jgi:hypothetical protein
MDTTQESRMNSPSGLPQRYESPRVAISEEEFLPVVNRRGGRLLQLASLLAGPRGQRVQLTRPLLADLMSQSMQIEELLDAYGARNNNRWRKFRAPVAALKRFSRVKYELLHIRQSLPTYRLEDALVFSEGLRAAMATMREILLRACSQLHAQSQELGLRIDEELDPEVYTEMLPPGRLPNDRTRRRVDSAAETVARLTTAYLNLAAQASLLEKTRPGNGEEYNKLVPEPIGEESLRNLQHRFHNLQSMYDTWVSETETECLDRDLPVLRGHVSIVFHLLQSGTDLAHYYERHVVGPGREDCDEENSMVTGKVLLDLLMDHVLAPAKAFLESGKALCQTMLKRYAEMTSIEVSIPRYRGFHVRPSTLVAKIVMHYGSDVRMELDDESFDASSPLEIFRINEKINARKRRWLAKEVCSLDLEAFAGQDLHEPVKEAVQKTILTLAEQGKVVILQQPLEFSDSLECDCQRLFEQVIEEIARLQATGKIDIPLDLNVRLVGDRRVLEDIKLLADNGYGEDNFGNNIQLPSELTYLRR